MANNSPVLPTTASSSPGTGSREDEKLNSTSRGLSVIQHLKTDVTLNHADIPVIACCIVSGLCDSSAYNAWTCFVSMQTGNTIFLALGASNQPTSHPYGWLKSLLSIFAFICGCLFFANTRHFNPKSRGTLSISFFLQSLCIIIAASLVQTHIAPSSEDTSSTGNVSFIELLPLFFLAFQSGGQIVTSRILGFNEVPTTVLTSVYCDIAMDPKLLRPENVKRNRRVAAVLCILVGGIVGGWLAKSRGGLASALWVAAAIKVGICVSWTVWTGAEI